MSDVGNFYAGRTLETTFLPDDRGILHQTWLILRETPFLAQTLPEKVRNTFRILVTSII